MTHQKATTFLSILLYTLFVAAQEDTIEKEGLVEKIVDALSETKVNVLAQYKQDLFKPLTGPFFKPVWELGSPYNVFGTIGFPQLNEMESEIISPRFVQNKSIAFYEVEDGGYRLYKLSVNVSFFDVFKSVLEALHTENTSTLYSPADCAVSLNTTLERVKYQETVRPRFFLPIFVDIHRILLRSHEQCEEMGEEYDCAPTLQSYTQLLWMYSWVVCSILGSSEVYDVDGICPKICRPHTIEVISSGLGSPMGSQVVYQKNASENAIDVCEQINHALAGSCEIKRNTAGVYMDDLKLPVAPNQGDRSETYPRIRLQRETNTYCSVVNLSNRPLSEKERTLLDKGVNFTLSKRVIRSKEIISSVESVFQKLPSMEAERLRIQLVTVLKSQQPGDPNITPTERRALNTLKLVDNIVITKADKSKATVVMNKSDYLQKCTSKAYEWSVRDGYRGCLLVPRIMESASISNTSTWRIDCLPEENICDKQGSDACYYRLRHESQGDTLHPTDTVQISYHPFCHCRDNYAGPLCNITHDPCKHPINLAITDPKNYLNIHIPDGPHVPLYYENDSARASGDWLCKAHGTASKCEKNNATEGGFECICERGFTRDTTYSRYDNCMKVIKAVNISDGDGSGAVICGENKCLNNGTCVRKPTQSSTRYNDTYEYPELDEALVCLCPPGYFGVSCDVVENKWSVWDAWSPCVPSCGNWRYKYRMRSCIGDAGCLGSALESDRCEDTKCELISAIENVSSIQGPSGSEGRYHSVTQSTLLIWMLGFLLPLEMLLIFIGVVILEKCILKY
ncbi:hypothetical protein T265_07902 [Opisthorchis viverrini]|uniref:EGF-like domain-containing protein n=1 Tax=Opisthorchis viverrini TaxID=6198 RepID=A0A074ZAU1_OPIVI|nr:hypothetical protein T265_07902 [Opisthorchis viverrini]KER24426.1 hypothetical protein T265_07902 [Opisthorchis viverrini]